MRISSSDKISNAIILNEWLKWFCLGFHKDAEMPHQNEATGVKTTLLILFCILT